MYTNRSRAIALVGLRGEALGGGVGGRAPKPLIIIESQGFNSFHSYLHDQLVYKKAGKERIKVEEEF